MSSRQVARRLRMLGHPTKWRPCLEIVRGIWIGPDASGRELRQQGLAYLEDIALDQRCLRAAEEPGSAAAARVILSDAHIAVQWETPIGKGKRRPKAQTGRQDRASQPKSSGSRSPQTDSRSRAGPSTMDAAACPLREPEGPGFLRHRPSRSCDSSRVGLSRRRQERRTGIVNGARKAA